MRFCYLIQGATKLLEEFHYPNSDAVFVASYDKPFVSDRVQWSYFIPKSTWAQGRNILIDKARAMGDYDYFVYCDDDARFASGDLAEFEASVRRTQPLVGVPLMSRASRKGIVLPGQDVQRAILIDEQVMALHRSLVGRVGISPIVTDYDGVSWWISCSILQSILVRDYHAYVHQYNRIRVRNDVHRFKDDTDIDGGTSSYMTAAAGADEESHVVDWFARQGEPYELGLLKRMVRPQRLLSVRRMMYHLTVEARLKRLARDWRSRPANENDLG